MEKISFIIPSRSNLAFLKQAYYSIRENIGTEHEIVMLYDASDDVTWEWLESLEDEVCENCNGNNRGNFKKKDCHACKGKGTR